MRRLLGLVLLGLLPLSASADEPKPNTLTPKEIADGWLLLFDGETTFGWNIDGEATVKDGLLVLGGEKETRAHPTTEFGDYVLRFQCRAGKDGKAKGTPFSLLSRVSPIKLTA